MPKAKRVRKVYASRHSNLFVAMDTPGASRPHKVLRFSAGRYATDDPEEQAHIEQLTDFGRTITVVSETPINEGAES